VAAMSDRFAAPSRAERKFGRSVSASCRRDFVKHRHGQRYCSEACRKTASDKRLGRLSTDARYVHKRRIRALRSGDLDGRSQKHRNHPKFINEINNLNGSISRSTPLISGTSWPIDLIGGGSRRVGPVNGLPLDLASAVVAAELRGVPVVRGGGLNG
jgi:hypothetical protein